MHISACVNKRTRGFQKTQLNNKNKPEMMCQKYLRHKQMNYQRQFVVPPYIVDFYIPDFALAIEIDGGVHKKTENRDMCRDSYIQSFGICVVRYKTYDNKQLMFKWLDSLLLEFPVIGNTRRRKINKKIKIAHGIYCSPFIKDKYFSSYQEMFETYAKYKSKKRHIKKLEKIETMFPGWIEKRKKAGFKPPK